MSETNENEVNTRSFTIRLTLEDQVALAELCDLYGLNRPSTLRRAMRQALGGHKKLGKSGYFVPAGESRPAEFHIRLVRKAGNGH
jgi:hypothetical protein